MMDQLDYDYSANKVTKIEDLTTDTIDGSYGFRDSSDVTIEYSYDVNGNMSKDKNKGIDSIYYNHLNLPVRFVFNSGFEIHYEYDASGSKVSRKEIASDATQTKEYVYSGAFVYESHSAGSPVTLSFMSTGNGRLKIESSTIHEEYFVKDHLGNTRITLRSAPSAQSFTYQQQNHYYAFGLTIEDLSTQLSPESSNRITYNGKEFDKELNWYHYGARFYDPQVGRWWSLDNADQYHSAYLFVNNNTINIIDKDGNFGDPTTFAIWISQILASSQKYEPRGNGLYQRAEPSSSVFDGVKTAFQNWFNTSFTKSNNIVPSGSFVQDNITNYTYKSLNFAKTNTAYLNIGFGKTTMGTGIQLSTTFLSSGEVVTSFGADGTLGIGVPFSASFGIAFNTDGSEVTGNDIAGWVLALLQVLELVVSF